MSEASKVIIHIVHGDEEDTLLLILRINGRPG
jgi:hypothetical protein